MKEEVEVIRETLVLLFVMAWHYLLVRKCYSFQLSFEAIFMDFDIQRMREEIEGVQSTDK